MDNALGRGDSVFGPFLVHAKTYSHATELLVLGAAVGWTAWGSGDSVEQLAWIVVLPIAWGMATSRWAAAALMAGYYFAAARGLIFGTGAFFGGNVGLGLGLLFWGSACVLLTVPFFFLWSGDRRQRPWRFLAAVAVSVLPPLAIIGWVSPLAIAGVLFPGYGWLGLALTLGVLLALATGHWRWIVVLGSVALACNAIDLWAPAPAKKPSAWQGVNTSFPNIYSGGGGDAGRLLASMQRVQWLERFATTIPAGQVRVLPETVAGVFDVGARYELQKTEAALRSRNARLIVGAEVPQEDGQYKNALLVLGAEKGEDKLLVQSIPVPVVMWKPWAADGAVGNMFGRKNVGKVQGVRVAGVICYEQVLAFSWLWTMLDRPEVLMVASNVWWARGTSIPAIQLQMARAFGRLFGVGVVVARND